MLKIIISPAKKMNITDEYPCRLTSPVFLERARQLHAALLSLSFAELKKLWNCSEKLALQNYEQLHTLALDKHLTPALLAYEGIQYQYMAPHIFSGPQWEYAEKHLRILSGFYGILRPTDGVVPYRLEMQSRTDFVLNLASKEYSRAVEPHLPKSVRFLTCTFGEHKDGKVIEKGTMCKMARGQMVRWMAENQVEDVRELQNFHHLNYLYHKELSSDTEYVFLKERTDL